ncbi:MAG: hypothetical protein ACXABV_16240, partial [Candidatus Thorarchaeota archaeon]
VEGSILHYLITYDHDCSLTCSFCLLAPVPPIRATEDQLRYGHLCGQLDISVWDIRLLLWWM